MNKLFFLILLPFTTNSATIPVIWELGPLPEADLNKIRHAYLVPGLSINDTQYASGHYKVTTTETLENLYLLEAYSDTYIPDEHKGIYVFPSAPTCDYAYHEGTTPRGWTYRYFTAPGGDTIGQTYPVQINLRGGPGRTTIAAYFPSGSIAGDNPRIQCWVTGVNRDDPSKMMRIGYYGAVMTTNVAVTRVYPEYLTAKTDSAGRFTASFTLYSSSNSAYHNQIRVQGNGTNVTSVTLNGIASHQEDWYIDPPPIENMTHTASSALIRINGVVPNPGQGEYRLNITWWLP